MKNFILVLTFISSFSFAANNKCINYFLDSQNSIKNSRAVAIPDNEVLELEGSKVRISLTKLSDKVIKLLDKNKRMPTLEEISTETKIELDALKGFFAKTSSPSLIQIVSMGKDKHSSVFEYFERIYAAEAMKYLKNNFEIPQDSVIANQIGERVSVSELRAIYGSYKGAILRIQEYNPKELKKFIDKILVAYTRVAKELGRSPTLHEVALELEITSEQLSKLIGKNKIFEKFEDIYDLAADRSPKIFSNIQNVSVFTEERLNRALKAMREGESIVLTSAVAGVQINQGFFNALKAYSKENKAPTVIRPVNLQTTGLSNELLNSDFAHVIINSVELDPTLFLYNLKLLPTMGNPLTGLKKALPGQTTIVGHIQRRVETRASVNSRYYPVFNISTGAITKPHYTGGKYVRERVAALAELRHFNGAVILEKTSARRNGIDIEGVGRFHIRFIEFVEKNKYGEPIANPYFMDLDKKYHADGSISPVRLEALLFGDLHFGATDQRAFLEAKLRLVSTLKPKRIYTEDDYDGKEINHHEKEKIIAQYMLAKWGANNLEEGLHHLRINLEAMLEASDKYTVIIRKRSNHPHWVERYLQSGYFMKEPQNVKIGLELARAMIEGMDPIDYFLKKHMDPELYKRIVTLKAGEPMYEGDNPVLVDMHGDKGTNGARGSINAFIEAVPAAVFGHTHHHEVFNRIVNMPGMPEVPQDYAREGFSKALVGNAGVGPNGEIQVYIYDAFSGEYFRDKSKPLSSPEVFFRPGFPKAQPTYDPTASTVEERVRANPGASDMGQFR